MAKKKLRYNGRDKFKKCVSEIVNDDTDIQRIEQLEETIRTLLSIFYGTNDWVDSTGETMVDDSNEGIVFLEQDANGIMQRLSKLESEVLIFNE